MGAGNISWGLWKNNKSSYPLSHLSGPSKFLSIHLSTDNEAQSRLQKKLNSISFLNMPRSELLNRLVVLFLIFF